jgi:hypothetical protein
MLAKLEHLMNRRARVMDDESSNALLAEDSRCIEAFGNYRDDVEEMIMGAAFWVMGGGSYWNKPTQFGRTRHDY